MQRAGGVPFFLRSCALALRADVDAAIPWDVAQSVRQRIAALQPQAQEVLREAAVVGRVAERWLLTEVSTRPRSEFRAGLDEAWLSRLLEERGASAYGFAHDLVREVVYADLSAAQKAALRERVATVLERSTGGAAVDTLAYHYARSDDADKAVQYLQRAADRAMAQGAVSAASSSVGTLPIACSDVDDTLPPRRYWPGSATS